MLSKSRNAGLYVLVQNFSVKKAYFAKIKIYYKLPETKSLLSQNKRFMAEKIVVENSWKRFIEGDSITSDQESLLSTSTWYLIEDMWEKRKNTGTLFSDLQTTRKTHSEAKSCKIDFSVDLCLVTTQKTR
jgi:hypothetical protein